MHLEGFPCKALDSRILYRPCIRCGSDAVAHSSAQVCNCKVYACHKPDLASVPVASALYTSVNMRCLSTSRPCGQRCPVVPRNSSRGQVACRVAAKESVDEVNVVEAQKRDLQKMLDKPYKYGFQTMIESDTFPPGLDEDVVRAISAKKDEPEWLLDFRLRAFRKWQTMETPEWSDNQYPPINYQSLSYYSEPKQKEKKASLDEVDPELLRTFDKLGIPLNEQKRLSNVAVDAVFDSVSIATTFREELGKAGVVFCSMSEAVKEYPDLVREHMGSVV